MSCMSCSAMLCFQRVSGALNCSAQHGHDMDVVSEKEQSSAADFNWSLFQFCQYLAEIRDWKLVDAIPEIDRAIGRGEVPHRFFEKIDGKLIAGQGDPLFWQSAVRLHVSKDATGNVTNVQALGVHGWDHDRFTCGVPERVVRERYSQKATSATKDFILRASAPPWPAHHSRLAQHRRRDCQPLH